MEAWVILGSIPRVDGQPEEDKDKDKEKEKESSTCSALALVPPPRVSRLTVSARVFPKAPTPRHFPFVLATFCPGASSYNLVAPPQEYMANRFLRAWDLPRAVS